MRRILALLTLCVAAPVYANVVPPPELTRPGHFTRDALPWAKPGRNFAVVIDTLNVARNLHRQDAISTIEETWWTRPQPWPDVDVVIWFTTYNDWAYAAYYSPLANDIEGLGYGEHLSEITGVSYPDVFDISPDTLSGMVVANDYSIYIMQPWFLPLVVEQELGHKWCCFVRESVGDASPTEMLGRDHSHWSYFLETGGSPMEGNAWLWDGASSFTTNTRAVFQAGDGTTPLSELDLYLMGLIPPAEVDPWYVIQNPDVMGQHDIYGEVINPGSGPQYDRDVTITGTKFDFSIADVIDRNGPRIPATWDGDLRIAFVLIVQPGEEESGLIFGQVGLIVDQTEDIWYTATGGRSIINNQTVTTFGAAGDACDGAALNCGDGLDCVTYGGAQRCAAACEMWCEIDECCVPTAGGNHCFGTDVATCVPPLPHPVGDRCEDGLPCEDGGICFADPSFGASYCAGVCTSKADCPEGMECLDTTGSIKLCIWQSSPPGVDGYPCATPDECDSNLCLAGHCSSICDPAAPECVPGTTCQATAGAQFVCVPAADDGGGKWCAVGGGRGGLAGAVGGALALLCMIFAVRCRRR
jgi:hypothetical protein